MTHKVYESNRTVSQVALCVFATRAYIKEEMNPLEKCEIDRLQQIDLMTSHRGQLPSLLREKGRRSTYPVAIGLENLLAIVRKRDLAAEFQVPGKGPLLQAELEKAVRHTGELEKLRSTASHHSDISKLEKELAETLERLATLIERAL